MLPFELDPSHHIIVYDDHLHRPVYFSWKGAWYKVTGSCEGCKGDCCIRAPIPEYDDGKGGCKHHAVTGECLVQTAKPVGCALFPSGLPEHYYTQLREVMETTCRLTVERVP